MPGYNEFLLFYGWIGSPEEVNVLEKKLTKL